MTHLQNAIIVEGIMGWEVSNSGVKSVTLCKGAHWFSLYCDRDLYFPVPIPDRERTLT